MKYCKKCFRNVREDVDVCPYCGAPGLTEYGSGTSGEDFSCSKPSEVERKLEQKIEDIQPPKVKKDAYSVPEKSPFSILDEDNSTDAYGNVIDSKDDCNKVEIDAYGSPKHTDENCDNAPDNPSTKYTKTIYISGNNKSDMMRIEYLRMLKNIDGITKERIDELMKKYDEQHSGKEFKTTTYRTVITQKNNTGQSFGSTLVVTLVMIFFGFYSQIFGIIALMVYKNMIKHYSDPRIKSLITLSNIFIIIFIAMMIIKAIPILISLFSLYNYGTYEGGY